jgi:dipeptide/tripeptide permease
MEPTTSNQSNAPNDANTDATKEKNLRLFQRGLTWMAVGVGIMGLSFMIQFLLFQSDDRSFIVPMYVLTTLGSLCVMKGLVDAFGF